MTSNVASLRNVSKRFRGVVLFENVSLEIDRGATYGLIGPNGSGKSVLLKMLCGFVLPDNGEVRIAPEFLSPGRTYPERFGLTIDGPAYLAGLSAFDNLQRLASIRGLITADRVREVLDSVGLDGRSRQKVRTFSLGMKQKLSLAQAIMEDPDVLLLDEPFNALDEHSVETVKHILRDLKAAGKTIIFTSHIRQDIDELSDHVYSINANRIELVENHR